MRNFTVEDGSTIAIGDTVCLVAGKVKKATIAQNAPLKLDVRPCPTMAGGTEMAEQLFKFNACVNRICTPGDSQCLQTFVHMATCNGEAGVKRNDIIKTFCRWPKIEEI